MKWMVNEMVKVFVVYDTKYGNTKLVAEKIVEGMKEADGIEASIGDVEETPPETAAAFDAILVGSPNHFGGPVRGINRFIDKLGKLDLEAKWIAVFDTYLGEDFEKAVKKMEKRIGEKVPGLKLITSGLSIKVDGMKGPVTDGEFPKCKEFGKKIATLLKT
jgi:flavorubredoxin